MNGTNVSGLVFEGIAGTGKTTTLNSLLKSSHWNNKPFISSYVLSEHHTLRVLENTFLDKTLKKTDSIELLEFHTSHLEKLQSNLTQTNWLERDRVNQKLPYIFERFHLTHVYHYDDVSWADVSSVDERLRELKARLVLFTIDEADIQERVIEDHKKAGWQDYLQTLGRNDEEIRQHFTEKQNQIRDLIDKTSLPVVEINTSKNNTESILDIIFDFWKLY